MDSRTIRFVSQLPAGVGTVLCAVVPPALSPGQSLDAVGRIAATLEPVRKIVYETVGGWHGYMTTSRPVFETSLKRIEEYLAQLNLLKVRPTQKTGG